MFQYINAYIYERGGYPLNFIFSQFSAVDICGGVKLPQNFSRPPQILLQNIGNICVHWKKLRENEIERIRSYTKEIYLARKNCILQVLFSDCLFWEKVYALKNNFHFTSERKIALSKNRSLDLSFPDSYVLSYNLSYHLGHLKNSLKISYTVNPYIFYKYEKNLNLHRLFHYLRLSNSVFVMNIWMSIKIKISI